MNIHYVRYFVYITSSFVRVIPMNFNRFLFIIVPVIFVMSSAGAVEYRPVPMGRISDERVGVLAQSFSKTYRNNGMIGLAKVISSCYISADKSKIKLSECIIQDMAATQINLLFFAQHSVEGTPDDSDFFSRPSLNVHLTKYVSIGFVDVNELDTYVGNSYERLMKDISTRIE